MKKLILAVMAALTISLSPVYAAECVNDTQEAILTRLDEAHAKTKEIPNQLVQAMIAKLGPPPSSDGTAEDIHVFRSDLNDASALFIMQKGCFIYRVGPGSPENVDHFLERMTDPA